MSESGNNLQDLIKSEPRFSNESAMMYWSMLFTFMHALTDKKVDKEVRKIMDITAKILAAENPPIDCPEEMDMCINAMLHALNQPYSN